MQLLAKIDIAIFQKYAQMVKPPTQSHVWVKMKSSSGWKPSFAAGHSLQLLAKNEPFWMYCLLAHPSKEVESGSVDFWSEFMFRDKFDQNHTFSHIFPLKIFPWKVTRFGTLKWQIENVLGFPLKVEHDSIQEYPNSSSSLHSAGPAGHGETVCSHSPLFCHHQRCSHQRCDGRPSHLPNVRSRWTI